MKRTLMLIPVGTNIGLTTVSIGLIRKIQENDFKIKFFKPIFNSFDGKESLDHTTKILKNMSSISCLHPIKVKNANNFLIPKYRQSILENILLKIDSEKKNNDILFLEGVCFRFSSFLSNIINYEIAQATNAEIIFLFTIRKNNIVDISNNMKIINECFLKKKYINIHGIIINEFKTINFDCEGNFINYFDMFNTIIKKDNNSSVNYDFLYKSYKIPILGYIPWYSKLIEPNLEKVSRYFKACLINQFNLNSLFVNSVVLYNKNSLLKNKSNVLSRVILIVSLDNLHDLDDILDYVNQNNCINALFLIDSKEFYINSLKICINKKKICIPVFSIKYNLLKIIDLFKKFSFKISSKDSEKFEIIREYVSMHIHDNFISSLQNKNLYKYPVSPIVFIHNLKKLAKKKKKNILLPEGNELRIIKAASICVHQDIANCILLGNPNTIRKLAKLNGIELEPNIRILNPTLIRDKYIERYLQLRCKYKITTFQAKKILQDDSILSTLILESNEVDGLVSGSVNTTSNTILPALQLIKTSRNSSLISSVFFMLLPDRVLLYADCAVNPNPSASQLAEIAIQSANTALLFGIFPKIAMLSYATGSSSSGKKVENIRKATNIVRSSCPHFIVEGPIQYDAAIDNVVSQLKCPNSVINGEATVFIFPDLNSGNIAYKAVQRSTNIISIGPILQGIRKPVNDLSRGASVQDIVYTIAVTSVQSK
ncbi:MAG: phosphate acetyltransferase [Buchnera aphidicola (Nurudea yanoniella)]